MSEPKTKGQLWDDAVHLHALINGLDIVLDSLDCAPTPAKNAVSGLITEILEKSERLCDALDVLDSA